MSREKIISFTIHCARSLRGGVEEVGQLNDERALGRPLGDDEGEYSRSGRILPSISYPSSSAW